MHYEISVAKNKTHLFATHSCITKDDLDKVYREITHAFKKEDGYEVNVFHHDLKVTCVTMMQEWTGVSKFCGKNENEMASLLHAAG